MDTLEASLASDVFAIPASLPMAGDPMLSAVVTMTQELFAGEPIIERSFDPEDPEHTFVVFTVKSVGDPRQLLARRREWHERIARLSPGDCGRLQLSIIPS